MPHKSKTTVGPFERAFGRPKPLTARQRAAKKRKAEYAKQEAAYAEFDRRRREMIAGKSKPLKGGKPTAAQIRTRRASERRARLMKGTALGRLAEVLSSEQPPKPLRKKK